MKVLIHGAEPRKLVESRAVAVASGHEIVPVASMGEVEAAFSDAVPPDGAIFAGADAGQQVAALRASLGRKPVWVAAWVPAEHAAFEALGAGADDVLVGPVESAALARRLAVGERYLAQARRQQRLRYMARHPAVRDPQTHTLRPEVLHVQAELAIDRAARTGLAVSVITVEAAAAGLPSDTDLSPLVLGRVAPSLRRGDGLAIAENRSFIALLEGTGPEEAHRIAEDMYARITRLPEAGGAVAFTAAIGVATHQPGMPTRTGRSLVDAAGNALASAWLSGGGVSVARPGKARQRPGSA